MNSMTSNSEYRSGWTTVPLSSVCDVRDGTHESPKYHLRGVPLVTSKYMRDGKIYPHEAPLISPQDARRINSRSKVDRGDVLLSMIGTVGNAVLVSDVPDYCIKNMALLKPQNILPEFLIHFVNGPIFQRRVEDGSSGGIQSFISLGKLRSTLIDLPSLDEQRSIAAMLNDAERFIEDQKQLIAKKQAIKTGMMQQLLTGKTRLHGYSEPWATVRLGSLGTFHKGKGIKRDDVVTSGVPCIRYGQIYTEYENYVFTTKSFVSNETAATAFLLRTGDLLFAGSGETRDEIGKCVAYVGELSAVAGGDIVVLRGKSFNPVFCGLLLNTPSVAIQKSRSGQGDAVVHISSRALEQIEITIPCFEEQSAIAEIFIDMDQEISVLKSRLEKAKAIKQGMMQELLTGKTRLVGEGVAS